MKESLSAEKIAEIIMSKPIVSTKGDIKVRSAEIRFSFDANGIYLDSIEDRPPTLRTVKKDPQK